MSRCPELAKWDVHFIEDYVDEETSKPTRVPAMMPTRRCEWCIRLPACLDKKLYEIEATM